MPRKKKNPITGITSDPQNKLVVQKSNQLSALWRSDLTLSEFKIMDAYLARIDSHNTSDRAVRFQKGEIERLLGVKKINVAELKERVQHLMNPLIIDDSPRSFRGICLFEEAFCEADSNGVWQVDLECTQKAMRYFFNVERMGYYRYKLRCVSSLTSRYTYVLFLYLEQNRFRKSWEVGLDELKHYLNCDTEENYKEFRRFNDKILKRCQTELNEKTECHFTYETVKNGRTVTAIRFTLETLSMEFVSSAPEQPSLFDEVSGSAPASAFCDGIFSAAETDELRSLLSALPEEDRDRRIEQKYQLMKVYNEKKPVKNKFLYVKKALEKDCKKSAAPDQPVAEQEHSFDTQEFLDLAMKRSFKNETDGGKKE